MDMNAVQANLSPVSTTITASEKNLLANKYCFLPEETVQNASQDFLQIPHILDAASSLVCSRQLETPFCSSPNLPEQFLSSENCFRFGSSFESNGNYFNVLSDHPNEDLELSCEQSLDTESTLEPTIIAVCSPVIDHMHDHMMCGENVPIIQATLLNAEDGYLKHSKT